MKESITDFLQDVLPALKNLTPAATFVNVRLQITTSTFLSFTTFPTVEQKLSAVEAVLLNQLSHLSHLYSIFLGGDSKTSAEVLSAQLFDLNKNVSVLLHQTNSSPSIFALDSTLPLPLPSVLSSEWRICMARVGALGDSYQTL